MVRVLLPLGFALSVAAGGQAAADAPRVVASIKPVHSLVSAVMKGVGTPALMLKGGASPHAYSLRPSDARTLANARVVFWIGEDLEQFLTKPLAALSKKARIVELSEVKGVTLLDVREGGAWEGHDDDHEEHGHGKHTHGKAKKAHGHEKHEHGHEKHGHKKHGHAKHDHDKHEHAKKAKSGGHAHAHGEHDMHLWLDPRNAAAMTKAIVATLSKTDPANAAKYAANGAALEARLKALDGKLARELAPVQKAPFVVFHDAYQYFERRYGLRAVGSITLSPERKPGAKRLTEIRTKVRTTGARCVFSEPQFRPTLVKTVIEGTKARSAELDPLGAAVPAGENAYFTIMTKLSASLRGCLAGQS